MENRTFEHGGFTVEVEWKVDEHPDLSHLGEYGSQFKEWSVDRQFGFLYGEDYDEDDEIEVLATDQHRGTSRECRYWYAPMGLCYSTTDTPDQDELVKYILQDYDLIEDYNRGGWCMMGCVVTVSAAGVEVGHGSCWGIESNAGDHADVIEAECIEEALYEARDAIPETAFGLLVTATRLLWTGIRAVGC